MGAVSEVKVLTNRHQLPYPDREEQLTALLDYYCLLYGVVAQATTQALLGQYHTVVYHQRTSHYFEMQRNISIDQIMSKNSKTEEAVEAQAPPPSSPFHEDSILGTIEPLPPLPASRIQSFRGIPGAFASGPEFARPPRDHWGPARGQGVPFSTADNGSSESGVAEVDTNLVHAREVREDEENPLGLVQAELVPPNKTASRLCGRGAPENRRSCKVAAFVCVVLLLAEVAVILAIFGPWRHDNSNENSKQTNERNSTRRTPEEEYLWSVLEEAPLPFIHAPGANFNVTVQGIAFEWLLNDPNLMNYSSTRILQRYTLSIFYHATQGDRWLQKTHWNSYAHHECSWFAGDAFNTFGPYLYADSPCDDGIYTRLWFQQNNLAGTIPEEIYFGLPSLTSISFFNNSQLTGTISTQTHKLESLRSLSLFGTDIAGTLPSELGLVTSLEMLYLAKLIPHDGELLRGPLPSELGKLTNLQQISLWGNRITSTLPTEMGTMSDMELLLVNTNLISGAIPSELGNLK